MATLQICHRHVRTIESCWELQTTRLKREALIERVREVQGNVDRLEKLRSGEETYLWFRKEGRPAREDDCLGPFKFVGVGGDEFSVDSKVVWERHAGGWGVGAFLEEGNVVVSGEFDWIVKDPEMMEMVFEMYLHHLQEQNGLPNFGWCRQVALVCAAGDATGPGRTGVPSGCRRNSSISLHHWRRLPCVASCGCALAL
jgi:hypothetical protein